MEYEDRVSISTPEGVEIELVLAGLGSRLAARLIDFAFEALLGLAVFFVIGLIASSVSGSDDLGLAAGAGFVFFTFLFYDTLFEAFREGQTPGKRRLGIRVLGDGGEPVSFRAALARNALRIVDEFMTLFLGALISIVRSDRNQRLGDMAGGTIVTLVAPASATRAELTVSVGAIPLLERARSWDVSAIGSEEVEVVRQFLSRRVALPVAPRARLAARLADRLRPRVIGLEPGLSDEWLLEVLAALKARH